MSWIILRGRCSQCCSWIGVRYPLVELAVGILWIACWLRFGPPQFSAIPELDLAFIPIPIAFSLTHFAGAALLCWLLLALAVLDAKYFWLPDLLTLPGIGIGFLLAVLEAKLMHASPAELLHAIWFRFLAILASAGLVLIIRLAYWLIRRQEGMGLGDAKLMAMLGAWLGLRGALESFALAVFAAALAALVWLIVLAIRRKTDEWAKMPLPLGTFLCAAALSEVFYPHWLLIWWQPGF